MKRTWLLLFAAFVAGCASAPSQEASPARDETVTGFGFFARASVAVANFQHHSLRFAIELVPTFYDAGRTTATAIVFEWQYF